MDEIIKLQDEILSYLRNNITKDEAYYILTTDKDMIEVLISDKTEANVSRSLIWNILSRRMICYCYSILMG